MAHGGKEGKMELQAGKFVYVRGSAIKVSADMSDGNAVEGKLDYVARVLPTFRRKVDFGFDRRSTVGMGSKFFGYFVVRVLSKNHFYYFMSADAAYDMVTCVEVQNDNINRLITIGNG